MNFASFQDTTVQPLKGINCLLIRVYTHSDENRFILFVKEKLNSKHFIKSLLNDMLNTLNNKLDEVFCVE